MAFTTNNHATWRTLCHRQLPHIAEFACRAYLEGFVRLHMPLNHIPSPRELNQEITPASGWQVTRTQSRYMTRMEWFTALQNRQFPITGYIRGTNELDFTPEPDIFHDVFGHQPYMTLPDFTELFDLFAQGYKKCQTDQHRRDLGRLAWFGYEFGLMRENGELKAFGAGLLSSFGEIQNLHAPHILKKPFTVEGVLQGAKPDGTRTGDRVTGVTMNNELFVLESLAHYKQELTRYLSRL